MFLLVLSMLVFAYAIISSLFKKREPAPTAFESFLMKKHNESEARLALKDSLNPQPVQAQDNVLTDDMIMYFDMIVANPTDQDLLNEFVTKFNMTDFTRAMCLKDQYIDYLRSKEKKPKKRSRK